MAGRPKGASLARLLAGTWIVACACKPATEEGTAAATYGNVSYGSDSAQVMDVFLPAGRGTSTPVVVFVHGGGWSGGDKSIFTSTDIGKFTSAGYACVNINYRLADNSRNIHDPVLSNDVTAALDYIAAHASQYQVSATTFAMVGHSAGAHLSLLASYRYDPAHRIKAVATLSGPTDLTDSTFLAVGGIPATIETYLGITLAAAPARWTAASPLSVATVTSAPTIILQGAVDALVPAVEGAKLDVRLTALGVAHGYHLYPTYNHDLNYGVLLHFPDDVWNPVLAWFATYVR